MGWNSIIAMGFLPCQLTRFRLVCPMNTYSVGLLRRDVPGHAGSLQPNPDRSHRPYFCDVLRWSAALSWLYS